VRSTLQKNIEQLGKKKVAGSSKLQGFAYHEVPFKDIALPTHRSNLKCRLRIITKQLNLKGKTGIDLGCSVGGFVFSCQLKGAQMTGYDYDKAAIGVAQAIEKKKKTGAKFVCTPISEAIFKNFHTINFCVWYSQFMWLVKSLGPKKGLQFMYDLSTRITDALFFETSIGDYGAGKEMKELKLTNLAAIKNALINNTCFTSITFKGAAQDNWAQRPIFVCTNPELKWKGRTATAERISRELVKKTYDKKSAVGNMRECKKLEVISLKKLRTNHFPKLKKDVDGHTFIMNYCGIPLTREHLPRNYRRQIKEILAELERAKIVHRDIRPLNLLVKDGIIKLIDFGWAVRSGDENDEYPKKLGSNFKAKGGFDDKYSLEKSIAHIKAGKKPAFGLIATYKIYAVNMYKRYRTLLPW